MNSMPGAMIPYELFNGKKVNFNIFIGEGRFLVLVDVVRI